MSQKKPKNGANKKAPIKNAYAPASVLIVDSDEFMQRNMKGYLNDIKVQKIDCLADATQVADMVEKAAYDLIILDWKNKKPPGSELLDFFRSCEKTMYTPLVLISGFVTKEDLTGAAQYPNTHFLVKPFTAEILINVVTRACKSAQDNFGDELLKQKRLFVLDHETEHASSEESIFEAAKLLGTDISHQGNKAYNGQDFSLTQTRQGHLSAGEDIRFEASAASAPKAATGVASEERTIQDEKGAGANPEKTGQELEELPASLGEKRNVDEQTEPKTQAESSEQSLAYESKHLQNSQMNYESEPTPSSFSAQDIDYRKPTKNVSQTEFHYGSEGISKKIAIQSALVVEPDESLANIVSKYLRDFGVNKVEKASNGENSWEKMKAQSYDLIIMDWRLRGLSGLCIYNRIRASKHLNKSLVVILCGFADREDFRILEEHPLTRYLEKPFQQEVFDQIVGNLGDFNAIYDEVHEFVRDTLDPMIMSQVDTGILLKEIQKRFQNNAKVLNIAAEYLLKKRLYVHAEKILIHALKHAPQNIAIISNLGKVYHHLNQPAKALRLLQKANFMSPHNVDRLCLMGEAGLTLQQPKQARDYFKKVLAIDVESSIAAAGLTISNNMEEHLGKYNQAQPLAMKFSSILNVIGITYVRNKEFDRGIEQYIAAMSFIQDDHVLARLQFNLGLAYLRARRFNHAENWFTSSSKLASEDFLKPALFLEKIGDFRTASSEELNRLSNEAFEIVAA
jgi:two-component system chemotaxis response regulator CheY